MFHYHLKRKEYNIYFRSANIYSSMKRILILSKFCFVILSLSAQPIQNKKVFDQAMLDLSQNKVENASQSFKALYQLDSINMNLAYLYGQSLVRLDSNLPYAIYLLNKAKAKYSPNYQPLQHTEINVSEYVFYYLCMAFYKNGDCDKTLNAMNDFYRIYSFSNEYYLVETQRFHRECQTKTKVTQNDKKPIFEAPPEKQHYVSTKSVSYTNKQPIYGVQIAATVKPQYTWEFANVKNVEVYIDENGIYRYIIGKFISPIMAERLLEVIKESGYQDAFIVNVKDKTKFSEKVVNMDDQPIDTEISGKVVFRCQLAAYKSETIPDDLAYIFIELDSVVSINDGNFTYLVVGEYPSIEQARSRTQELKEEGFKEAFVAAFNYQRKIDLKQAENYLINQQNALKETQQKHQKGKKKKQKTKN